MIIRSSLLLEKIDQFDQHYTKEIISKRQLNRLSNLLEEQHTPEIFDPLEYFFIPKTDLLTGVQCPVCFTLPMKRKRGRRVCLACSHSSSDAHISSLKDYYYLIQPTITNKQYRDFLQLSSRFIVQELLSAMHLQHTGTTKGSHYLLSNFEPEN